MQICACAPALKTVLQGPLRRLTAAFWPPMPSDGHPPTSQTSQVHHNAEEPASSPLTPSQNARWYQISRFAFERTLNRSVNLETVDAENADDTRVPGAASFGGSVSTGKTRKTSCERRGERDRKARKSAAAPSAPQASPRIVKQQTVEICGCDREAAPPCVGESVSDSLQGLGFVSGRGL